MLISRTSKASHGWAGRQSFVHSTMFAGSGMPHAETNRIFFYRNFAAQKTACIELYVIHAEKIIPLFDAISHIVRFVNPFSQKIDAFVLAIC